MTRKKFIVSIVIAFFTFTFITVGIINKKSIPALNEAQSEFDSFTNSVFMSEMSSNAFNLHFYLQNPEKYGFKDVPATVGSIDYNAMKNSENYYLNYINKLKSIDYSKLNNESKITYDIFMHYLNNELAFPDLCLNYEILSPTVGTQAQLPVLLSQYKLNNENDIATYIKILCSVYDYFKQIVEFEKIKSENGTFMSNVTADSVINQCKSFVESDEQFLIDTFSDRISNIPNISDEKKNKYIVLNEKIVKEYVLSAYRMLIKELSALKGKGKNNLGLCYNKNGKNYYQYLVQSYTGSSRSISEIESLIKSRFRKDLAILSTLSKDTKVYKAIYDDNNADNNNQNPMSPKKILNDLISKTKKDFPAPATTSYSVNYVPKSLEAHLSPAFYLSPPIDDTDNNQIYINNHESFANTDLYATLAHEGYPGHLYQSTYFAATNPPLIRNILNFGGYTEGWATYVELYSYKFRYSDEKIIKALQSNASYALALYCLADIGINYHGWTLDDTYDFFSSKGITDKTVSEDIFNRMVAEPANYLQYYVGYLEIIELKSTLKSLMGSSYSDMTFHTYMLNMGPAPFDVLNKYLTGK